MFINIFNSVQQAYTHADDLGEGSFKEIVDLLVASSKLLKEKTDGRLFNMCSWIADYENPPEEKFNPNATTHKRTELIRRCKSNVDKIYCLLLDVDGTMSLKDACEGWLDYDFFVYSTHSNSVEQTKFRLVVPLKTALTQSEFASRHAAMCSLFNVDGASFTLSQCFYLPSHSEENKDIAFMEHNDVGNRYDALQIKPIKLNTNVLVNYIPPTEKTPIGEIVYKTLMTGCDLHYCDAMTLAVLCKSHGMGYSDFRNIVTKAAAASSCLRSKDTDLKDLFNKGYVTHMTNKTALSLMNRMRCNTWRFKI